MTSATRDTVFLFCILLAAAMFGWIVGMLLL